MSKDKGRYINFDRIDRSIRQAISIGPSWEEVGRALNTPPIEEPRVKFQPYQYRRSDAGEARVRAGVARYHERRRQQKLAKGTT